jgi:hypothetical protein
MSVIGWYCKAYEQDRLESYPAWAAVKARYEASNGPLAALEVLFVHEDLAVTVGVVREQNVVLGEVTEEWRAFCDGQLRFSVPDYMRATPASSSSSDLSVDAQSSLA